MYDSTLGVTTSTDNPYVMPDDGHVLLAIRNSGNAVANVNITIDSFRFGLLVLNPGVEGLFLVSAVKGSKISYLSKNDLTITNCYFRKNGSMT